MSSTVYKRATRWPVEPSMYGLDPTLVSTDPPLLSTGLHCYSLVSIGLDWSLLQGWPNAAP